MNQRSEPSSQPLLEFLEESDSGTAHPQQDLGPQQDPAAAHRREGCLRPAASSWGQGCRVNDTRRRRGRDRGSRGEGQAGRGARVRAESSGVTAGEHPR